MKKLILLATVSIISFTILFFNMDAFAESLTDNNDSQTLKKQLKNFSSGRDIVCQNPDHVLVSRPNTEWACVSPYAALKLGWVFYGLTTHGSSVLIDGESYWITAKYPKWTASISSISYLDYTDSIKLSIKSTESGKLFVDIPNEMINTLFGNSTYIVLINNQKVDIHTEFYNDLTTLLVFDYPSDTIKVEILLNRDND